MSTWREAAEAFAGGGPPPLVLFLCRSNTAVSIMAEALLRHMAQGRVRVGSAGDKAGQRLNPYAVECLRAHDIATEELTSKPWGALFGEFRQPVRILISLTDPHLYAVGVNWDFPGSPRTVRAHWATPDPESVATNEIDTRLAFEELFFTLDGRVRRLLALPLERMSDEVLARELMRIGEVQAQLI
jgi:protein-tyrosine-phosphatase